MKGLKGGRTTQLTTPLVTLCSFPRFHRYNLVWNELNSTQANKIWFNFLLVLSKNRWPSLQTKFFTSYFLHSNTSLGNKRVLVDLEINYIFYPMFSMIMSASVDVSTPQEWSSVSDIKWVSPFCRAHGWASRPPRPWHALSHTHTHRGEDEHGEVLVCVCVRLGGGCVRRCIEVLYPNDKPTGLLARHN